MSRMFIRVWKIEKRVISEVELSKFEFQLLSVLKISNSKQGDYES